MMKDLHPSDSQSEEVLTFRYRHEEGPFILPHQTQKVAVTRKVRNSHDLSLLPSSKAFVFVYTLSGKAFFDGPNGRAALEEGSFLAYTTPALGSILYPPEKDGPWVHHWISFPGIDAVRIGRQMTERFGQVGTMESTSIGALRLAGLYELAKAHTELSAPDVSEAAYGFLMALWSEMKRQHLLNDANPVANRAFYECRSVKELALQTGYSRSHLSRKLQKYFNGHSPAKVMRENRIKHAKSLLAESDMSIAEVAAKVGFPRPSVFTTSFKREVGVTPSAYRRKSAVRTAGLRQLDF